MQREHRGHTGSIGRIGLIGLIGLSLVACSGEHEDEAAGGVSVELVAGMTSYSSVEAPATRAAKPAWVPEGYQLYSELSSMGVQHSNEHAAIGAFFTKDGTAEARKFSYGHDEKWRIDEEISSSGTYQLYGYVPYDAATASITPNVSYADGAVLTLSGLSSVNNKDVCIVVGAKEGTETTCAGLTTGQFDCGITSGPDARNYIYLLFDHLYASMRFSFRVDETYASLRKIKLRRLELQAYSDEDCTTPLKQKANATITLAKNTTGASPISSVDFSIDNTSSNMGYVTIYDDDPLTYLPSDKDGEGNYIYSDYMGFMPPTTNAFYKLRSTYDVYDRYNNLIRETCIAENKVNPQERFGLSTLSRSHMYTMRFTVAPTYLYVLSNPDLNNPTLTIE